MAGCEEGRRVRVRAAVPGDGALLAGRLRQADLAELQAAHGDEDPWRVLERGMDASEECWCATLDGLPVALFGRSEVTIHDWRWYAKVWMVGSDTVTQRPRDLLALARAWLPSLAQNTIAWNWIDSRNTAHIRFLQHLGARLYASRATVLKDPTVEFWPFFLDTAHVYSSSRDSRHWRGAVGVRLRGQEFPGRRSASRLP